MNWCTRNTVLSAVTLLTSYSSAQSRLLPDPSYLPAILDSTIDYSWDSETREWNPVYGGKWKYEYDSEGKLLTEIRCNWFPDENLWKSTSRILYSYDLSGNLMEETACDWDFYENDWIKSNRTQFSYDPKGNLREERSYHWTLHYNYWSIVECIKYSYDSLGYRTETKVMSWDKEANDWINETLQKNFYDDSGMLIEESSFDWRRGYNMWTGNSRTQYGYDSSGSLDLEHRSAWDNSINNWVWDYKNQYSYDSSGVVTDVVKSRWEVEREIWYPDYHYPYEYDSTGFLIGEYTYYWKRDISAWVPIRCVKYLNDASGKRTSERRFIWSAEEWKPEPMLCHGWCNGGRVDFVYDPYGYQIENILMDWNSENNQWINYTKTSSFWSFLNDGLLLDQMIELDENNNGSALKCSMLTGESYLRDSIHFSITGGNPDHLFRIDETTGDLLLDTSFIFDYESSPGYDLIVEALLSDSTGMIKDSALISIRVNNLNDNPPAMQDTIIYLDECLDHDHIVYKELGNLRSFDADGDLSPLVYSIVSGNVNGIFYLNPYSGALSVRYDSIDYEKQTSYALVVEVTDGTFAGQATISVQVNDQVETGVAQALVPGAIHDAVTLYPNPTTGMLTIDLPVDAGQGTVVEVKDMSGRIRLIRNLTDRKFDLSSLSRGVFFITIRSADFVTTRMVIKL